MSLTRGGSFKGNEFILQDWQEFNLIGPLLCWKNADDGYRRFTEGLFSTGRKNGKALALDTPIPTPEGWKMMGDLQIGDVIFDESGKPCSVTFVTETMLEHPCYEVVFSDGSSITADAEHVWETKTRRGTGLKTTEEIKRTLTRGTRLDTNHRIKIAGALELPDQVLPIDPYALGFWLGNNKSADATVYINKNDKQLFGELQKCVNAHVRTIENNLMEVWLGARNPAICQRNHLKTVGEKCKQCERETDRARRRGEHVQRGTGTMQAKLRTLGLLKNKHIPAVYLRASFAQRLALLQGLMDTDGYVSAAGQCEFTTIKKHIAEQVRELVLSLGMKATTTEGRAMLDGRDCGPKYRVQFWAYSDLPVFRLERKRARQKPRPAKATRNASRSIVDVRPVPSVPVRCIQVDSPSHLYLAGESMIPTHNTETIAGLELVVFVLDEEPSGQQYCSSLTKEQAEELYQAAATMVEHDPFLNALIERVDSSLALKNRATGATFQIVSDNPDSIHGFKPYFAVIDEYHLQRTGELKGIYKGGTLADDQSVVLIFGTVGKNKNSPMGNECRKAEQILNGTLHMPSYFAYYCYAPDEEDGVELDPYSERAIKLANPGYPIAPKKKRIEEWIANAKMFPDDEFIYHWAILNRWAGAMGSPLRETAWNSCADPELWEKLLHQACIAGFDLGSTDDLTALVLVFVFEGMPAWLPFFFMPKGQVAKREKEHNLPYKAWSETPHPYLPGLKLLELTSGDMTDHDEVLDFASDLRTHYDILQARRDRYMAQMMGATMNKKGWKVVDINQDFAQMAPGCREVVRRIAMTKMRHPDHPILNEMRKNVRLNLHRKKTGLYMFTKDTPAEKIDGFDAGVIAMTGLLDQFEDLFAEKIDYGELDIWG